MPDERKLAKVTSCALGFTNGGKDQLCITFECEDTRDGRGKERISYYQLFETDANLEHAGKALRALGWDPDTNGWRLELIHQTPVIVGKEASVVIEEDDMTDANGNVIRDTAGNAKRRRRIKYVNDARGGGGLKNVMSAQDATSFSARLRARLSGQPMPASQPAPRQQSFATMPASDADDDVPF